jgi:very-short-patch-repair endonuclease
MGGAAEVFCQEAGMDRNQGGIKMENETTQGRPYQIVVGQAVQEGKVIRARQMRREMTPTEAMLWTRLRRNGLGVNFRRQQVIDGFIADFHCHSTALVVEIDGPIHDAEYDAERDSVFAGRGIRVLRFRSEDVLDKIGFVLSRIRGCLSRE